MIHQTVILEQQIVQQAPLQEAVVVEVEAVAEIRHLVKALTMRWTPTTALVGGILAVGQVKALPEPHPIL